MNGGIATIPLQLLARNDLSNTLAVLHVAKRPVVRSSRLFYVAIYLHGVANLERGIPNTLLILEITDFHVAKWNLYAAKMQRIVASDWT